MGFSLPFPPKPREIIYRREKTLGPPIKGDDYMINSDNTFRVACLFQFSLTIFFKTFIVFFGLVQFKVCLVCLPSGLVHLWKKRTVTLPAYLPKLMG